MGRVLSIAFEMLYPGLLERWDAGILVEQISREMLTALFDVAVAVGGAPDVETSTLMEYADACLRAGRFEGCDEACEQALHVLTGAVDAPEADLPSIANQAVGASGRTRDPATARQLLQLAAGLYERTGDRFSLAAVWRALGNTWRAESEGDRAVVCYRRAAELQSPDDRPLDHVETLIALADAEAHASTAIGPAGTLARAVHALVCAAESPDADLATIVTAARNVGGVGERLQCSTEARGAYELAARLLEATGDRDELGVVWHEIADTWASQGDMARAILSYRHAAGLKSGTDNPISCITTLLALADAERQAGTAQGRAEAVDEALRVLRRAVEASNVDILILSECVEALEEQTESLDRPDLARDATLLAARIRERRAELDPP